MLIAGVLLTLVMSTVARLNTAALAASHTLAERRRIEEAINDHIQLIQQSDSILSYDRLPERHRNRSGEQPSGLCITRRIFSHGPARAGTHES